jgi:mRNA interferase RelE/StbE
MTTYQLKYSDEARAALSALPGNYRQRIKRLIEGLGTNPRPAQARALRDNPNGYRLRLGPWRIIYRVHDEDQLVLIAAVRLKQGPETYHSVP